jgi:hypothetical protein
MFGVVPFVVFVPPEFFQSLLLFFYYLLEVVFWHVQLQFLDLKLSFQEPDRILADERANHRERSILRTGH